MSLTMQYGDILPQPIKPGSVIYFPSDVRDVTQRIR